MPQIGTSKIGVKRRESAFRNRNCNHFQWSWVLQNVLQGVQTGWLRHVWAVVAFAFLLLVYLTVENCPTKDYYYISLQRDIQIHLMMDEALVIKVFYLMNFSHFDFGGKLKHSGMQETLKMLTQFFDRSILMLNCKLNPNYVCQE